MHLWTYISCNDHAAKLVDDKHIQLWWRLTELLLKDLEDVLHDFGSVPKSHRNVTQCSDGVIWDQMGIPARKASWFLE